MQKDYIKDAPPLTPTEKREKERKKLKENFMI